MSYAARQDPDPARYTAWVRLQRWFGFYLNVTWITLLMRLVARLDLRGWRGVPRGPWILVPNHISHFEPFALLAVCPRKVNWLATAELYNPWLGRWFWNMVDCVPLHRDKAYDLKAMRRCRDRLAHGRVIGIYAEGGIRTDERSVLRGGELKAGAAALAQMAGVPVRPCLVIGTDRLYNWRVWFRRPTLYFWLGEPLSLDPALPARDARTDLTRRIGESLRAMHAELCALPSYSSDLDPRSPQEHWAKA